MNQVLSTEEILAIEHRGTKDEGLRFARAIEAAILAKLNSAEPVGEIRHHPGGCYEGSHIPAAPYDFPEFYGPLPPVGTKLYTTPQPDRTAGLEAALREALKGKDSDPK